MLFLQKQMLIKRQWKIGDSEVVAMPCLKNKIGYREVVAMPCLIIGLRIFIQKIILFELSIESCPANL